MNRKLTRRRLGLQQAGEISLAGPEPLERRLCLAALLGIGGAAVVGHEVAGYVSTDSGGGGATDLRGLFGAQTMPEMGLDLATLTGVAGSDDGTVYTVGMHGDGTYTTQNYVGGSLTGMVDFVGYAGSTNLAANRVIVSQANQPFYVGEGVTGLSLSGLFWDADPTQALLAPSTPDQFGTLRDALPDRTFVGSNIGLSAIGSPDAPFDPLAGNADGAGLDIEMDEFGTMAIGGSDARWLHTGSGFELFATSGMEVPPTSFGLPQGFSYVAPREGGGFWWGGESPDSNTLLPTFHAWNQENDLSFSGTPGELMIGEAVFGGRPIVGFDGLAGDYICDIGTSECVSVEDITGHDELLALFNVNGSAGFAVQTDSGPMIVSYAINNSTTAAQLTVNWGDGTDEEVFDTIVGTQVPVSHVFTRPGTFQVTVTDGSGESTTQDVVVSSHQLRTVDGRTTLLIGTTDDGERVSVSGKWLRVGRSLTRIDFRDVDKIGAVGGDGDDRFIFNLGKKVVDINLKAGGGNDFVYVVSAGINTVEGGDDDDFMIVRSRRSGGHEGFFAAYGDGGNDLMFLGGNGLAVGGTGRDTMLGRANFVTGGDVAVENRAALLDAVMLEFAGGRPDTESLRAATAPYIMDDHERDLLLFAGEFWFFGFEEDRFFSGRRRHNLAD